MIPIGSARAVALWTAASRVLGLFREMLFARLFGAGSVADAFQISFRLPNTFRRIFGEGAFASAMVPVLSALREKEGMDRVRGSAAALLKFLRRILGVLTVAGILAIGVVSWWSVPSARDPAKARLTGWLSAILFPYVYLICMTAAQGGILNVCGSFAVPALAPVLFNVIEILGLLAVWLWWSGPDQGNAAIFVVAAFVLLAGAVQYASQAWGLRGMDVAAAVPAGRQAAPPDRRDPAVAATLKGMLPMMAGLAPAQIAVLVDAWMAELMVGRTGAVAHLTYGHLLIHLPLAVAAVSVATVSFPLFSRLGARGDLAGLSRASLQAARQVLFGLAPAAVGLGFLSIPVVRLIYEGRRFDASATGWTALVVNAYAWGLVAMGLQQIGVRVLYSLGDRRTPVWVSLGMVTVNIALNLAWVGPYKEPGIAMATSVSAWLGMAATAVAVARRLPKGAVRSGTLLSILRTAVGCAALALFLWVVRGCCAGSGPTFAARTLAAVLGGAALYLGVVWMSGSEEVRNLLSRASGAGAEETT